MSDYLFHNITELKSPIGTFSVMYKEQKVPFSVAKNSFDIPYDVYEDEKIVKTFTTETNYSLEIDVCNLKIGEVYKLSFSAGILEFCDSDERTVALATTEDGWTVGVGMYNPNDDGELEQAIEYSKEKGYYAQKVIIEPPQYDESRLKGYSIWQSDDKSGFTFKLLDDTVKTIYFSVAWIKCEVDSEDDCEGAIGFWLT